MKPYLLTPILVLIILFSAFSGKNFNRTIYFSANAKTVGVFDRDSLLQSMPAYDQIMDSLNKYIITRSSYNTNSGLGTEIKQYIDRQVIFDRDSNYFSPFSKMVHHQDLEEFANSLTTSDQSISIIKLQKIVRRLDILQQAIVFEANKTQTEQGYQTVIDKITSQADTYKKAKIVNVTSEISKQLNQNSNNTQLIVDCIICGEDYSQKILQEKTIDISLPITDIDGNKYKCTKIGQQIWLSSNLNTEHYRNGVIIPEAKTMAEWKKYCREEKGCWRYSDDDSTLDHQCGKLYNWYAVLDSNGLAPTGWKIPDENELGIFVRFTGDSSGHKLKTSAGWESYVTKTSQGKITVSGNGTNQYGYNALPDGSYWWTTSEILDSPLIFYVTNYQAKIQIMPQSYTSSMPGENQFFAVSTSSGYCVRCIKESLR